MKKGIVIGLIGLLVVIGGLVAKPKKPYCGWCDARPCFNSRGCTSGCICAKIDGNYEGTCAAID